MTSIWRTKAIIYLRLFDLVIWPEPCAEGFTLSWCVLQQSFWSLWDRWCTFWSNFWVIELIYNKKEMKSNLNNDNLKNWHETPDRWSFHWIISEHSICFLKESKSWNQKQIQKKRNWKPGKHWSCHEKEDIHNLNCPIWNDLMSHGNYIIFQN